MTCVYVYYAPSASFSSLLFSILLIFPTWFFYHIKSRVCGWVTFLYMLSEKKPETLYLYCGVYPQVGVQSTYITSYYDCGKKWKKNPKDAKSSRRSFVFCSSLTSVDFSFPFSFLQNNFFYSSIMLLYFDGKKFWFSLVEAYKCKRTFSILFFTFAFCALDFLFQWNNVFR